MKNIKNLFVLTFLISCFFLNSSSAQDKIVLNVIYEFKYVRDLAQTDSPYKSIMILSLGKNSSRYCTHETYIKNNPKLLVERQKKQKELENSSKPTITVIGRPTLLINNSGAIINEEILKNTTNREMSVISHLGFKTYKVSSETPKINWEMTGDKKIIADYNCQKAIGNYAGRVYEVWFTPDIPFNDGPWKLAGLPGLILEAYDKKNEVSFKIKNISKNTDSEETTKSFLDSPFSITTNLKAYNRIKKEFETDPEAVSRGMFPNANLEIRNIDNDKDNSVKKTKKYNPIELNL